MSVKAKIPYYYYPPFSSSDHCIFLLFWFVEKNSFFSFFLNSFSVWQEKVLCLEQLDFQINANDLLKVWLSSDHWLHWFPNDFSLHTYNLPPLFSILHSKSSSYKSEVLHAPCIWIGMALLEVLQVYCKSLWIKKLGCTTKVNGEVFSVLFFLNLALRTQVST